MSFRLKWPTTSHVITQHFLANPENYRQFDLPGHEGIDIQARRGVQVRACADGTVYEAKSDDDKHPYGQRVRIRHDTPDGVYKTTYAHLSEVHVEVGQFVNAGAVVGLADNTGNSFGDHLHLTLKKDGATRGGETRFITEDGRKVTFQNDIIDPTPFLDPAPDHIPTRPDLSETTPIGTVASMIPPIVSISGRPVFAMRGLHGDDAATWMRDNGVRGWAVETVYSGGNLVNPQPVDFSSHEAAGVRVLVRWNYSFAKADGGLGTFPLRHLYSDFINWCTRSISASKGVWGNIIGNEPNRSAERPNLDDPITPQDVLAIYNPIWSQLSKLTRLSPPAIDPTNVETGEPREYWRQLLRGLSGAEFLALHAYSYGSGQAVDSTDKFADDPMKWQFHGFRMWEPLASVVFSEFPGHIQTPLIITEANHLHMRGDSNTKGWDGDAEHWIKSAYDYVLNWNRGPGTQFVHGVCLYRLKGDAWRIDDKPQLLEALRNNGESAS